MLIIIILQLVKRNTLYYIRVDTRNLIQKIFSPRVNHHACKSRYIFFLIKSIVLHTAGTLDSLGILIKNPDTWDSIYSIKIFSGCAPVISIFQKLPRRFWDQLTSKSLSESPPPPYFRESTGECQCYFCLNPQDLQFVGSTFK